MAVEQASRRATARASLSRVHDGWMALQVELQGQYSCDRLRRLRTYSTTTSWPRVAAMCLCTPLPCLTLITLVDCVQLASPEAGSYANYVFWARNYLIVLFISFAILEQFRICLSQLPLNYKETSVIAVFITSAGVGTQFALSQVVGFPLPFGLVAGTPSWTVVLLGCCWFLWGGLVRHQPKLQREGLNYLFVFLCQVALTLIYPAYIYVFNSLDSHGQTGFVLLLPLIKLTTKNWISRFLDGKDDMKPGFVIFNIEIFNALYVSCCMQTSTSKVTTIVLMLTDFIQAWISMKDLNDLFAQVQPMLHRLQRLGTEPQPTILDVALDIIAHDELFTVPKVAETKDDHSDMSPRTVMKMVGVKPMARKASRRVVPTADDGVTDRTANDEPSASCDVAAASAETTQPLALTEAQQHESRRVALIFSTLSREERVLFVTRTRQIFFVTEFVILIEYTEVVIPIIYSTYLSIVFSLPNRAYYPQIKQISQDRLHETIGNVMMYSALELVSFLIMSAILHRRVGISTAHQLAFVLQSQWIMVQSKFVLWTFYVVQSSLEHFGVDFSLQFAWLK